MADGIDGFIRDLKRNLLTLEVNTILKDNMTAEPMPSVPHALLDVAGEYTQALEGMGVNVDRFFTAAAGDARTVDVSPWLTAADRCVDPDALTVSRDTFDRLRRAAKAAMVAGGRRLPPLDSSSLVMASRICNNCDAIKAVFDRTPALAGTGTPLNRAALVGETDGGARFAADLPGADYLTVRKIWEVGVEDVVMQTVIQLDGDVVTRIREAHLRDPGAPTLMALHELGIKVSVGTWRHLLDIVQEVAEGALGAFRKVLTRS
ncbi:hypothetical protein [Azospirillum halopraeferens]|uniref:hypothetical protein n=1 Tax=Azospirillum halopraeferens TaxID=34010 RepID=UPI0003FE7653|nr:hypothetical protein [Azospirillum halopraeferens]